MKYGKFIGGGIGWAVGGPIGALLGIALGALYDSATAEKEEYETPRYMPPAQKQPTKAGDFGVSLLILSASVMKADGKVMRSELDYVKKFFIQQFGEEKAKEFISALKGILQRNINLRQVCLQIKANMAHPMRLQLLHYLFNLARADENISSSEVRIIYTIAGYLGISPKDFLSIKAMFVVETDSDYKILEIDPKSTDAEVKKAYRKMALKYHPDKVASLGEDYQKAAKEKFQKVQQAYENIMKQREK